MGNTAERERFDFIDLTKGIGIFLVVWGHAMEPRSVWLYSFHMPLFFFISGFLHRDRPIGAYLKNRLFRLYLPYAAFSTLSWLFFLAVAYFRGAGWQIRGRLPYLASIVTGTARNGGNDSIWFLPCLIVTGLLFLLVRKLRGAWLQIAAVAVLAAAGHWLGLRRILLPWKIDAALAGLVFYALGFTAGERRFLAGLDRLQPRVWLPCLLGLEALHIAAAYGNVAVSGIPKVAMISNSLGNYPLYLLAALAGTIVFTAICFRLKRLPLLNHLGAESLTVLALHKPLLYSFRHWTTGMDHGWWVYSLAAAVIATGLSLAAAPVLKRWAPWLVGAEGPASRKPATQ